MTVEILWPLFAEWSLKTAVVLLLGAAGMLALRRRSAALRHGLWMPLLAVALFAPLVVLAPLRLAWLPAIEEPGAELASAPVPVALAGTHGAEAAPGQGFMAGGEALSGGGTVGIAASAEPGGDTGIVFEENAGMGWSSRALDFFRRHWSWKAGVLAVWVVGMALICLRLLIGSLRLARLKSISRARPIPAEWLAALERIRLEFGVRRPVRLLVSEKVRSAFAWGVLRPVIALPASASGWSREDRDMVLRHELAHLSRHDGLAALITRLALACHWLNPLAWWVARSVTDLREQACDRLVLSSGCDPQRYAQLLFRAARHVVDAPQPLSATAVAETGTLERRVKMILNRKRESSRQPSADRRRPWISTLAFCAALAVVSLGFAQQGDEKKPSESMVMYLDGKWFAGSQLKGQIEKLSAEDAAEHVLTVVALGKVPAAAIEEVAAVSRAAGIADMMFYSADRTDHPWWDIESDVEFQMKAVGEAECAKCHDLEKHKSLAEGLSPDGLGVEHFITETGAEVAVDSSESYEAGVEAPGGSFGAMKNPQPTVLETKLAEITIPSVDLVDTPMRAALDFLGAKSMELDTIEADPSRKGINIVLKGSPPFVDTPISLNLANASLGQALNYVAELAGAPLRIDEHAIVIDVPGRGEPGGGDLGISEEERKVTVAKLENLILPSVEFNDTPLSDVLEFFRHKAIELDTIEPDPARKGINIVLLDAAGGSDAMVTLRLKSIPLGEALRYTAELSGMALTVEGSAVVLRRQAGQPAESDPFLE